MGEPLKSSIWTTVSAIVNVLPVYDMYVSGTRNHGSRHLSAAERLIVQERWLTSDNPEIGERRTADRVRIDFLINVESSWLNHWKSEPATMQRVSLQQLLIRRASDWPRVQPVNQILVIHELRAILRATNAADFFSDLESQRVTDVHTGLISPICQKGSNFYISYFTMFCFTSSYQRRLLMDSVMSVCA